MTLIIEASSDFKEVIWELFGVLFTASIAAKNLGRNIKSGSIGVIR
ncbi:MAG: hypothetical protein F6K22_12345 [Okeania sp. SIO2F4]|nr:hypothetical protein [Okeania sp. SIO2F4]NES03563.1 hypothetical protein [Okeania sp. SIO2F4]